MFQKTIKTAFISLISIILIHYLYVFFKTNLTVPKIKDLVERPEKKYKEIYASLSSKSTDTKPTIVPEKKPDGAGLDMKLELKNYLKGLEIVKPIPQGLVPAEKYDPFSINYEQI